MSVALLACATRSEFARPTTPAVPDLDRLASPFYLHGDFGLGAPEGLVGGGVGVAPTPWSSAELGGGMSDSGPQASLILALRAPVSEAATLGLSSGLSLGRNSITSGIRFDSEDPQYEKVWNWMLWSNSEVTLRHKLSAHTALRFHAGVAVSVRLWRRIPLLASRAAL